MRLSKQQIESLRAYMRAANGKVFNPLVRISFIM